MVMLTKFGSSFKNRQNAVINGVHTFKNEMHVYEIQEINSLNDA